LASRLASWQPRPKALSFSLRVRRSTRSGAHVTPRMGWRRDTLENKRPHEEKAQGKLGRWLSEDQHPGGLGHLAYNDISGRCAGHEEVEHLATRYSEIFRDAGRMPTAVLPSQFLKSALKCPPIADSKSANPVRFPPGFAKLATKPLPTGSPTNTKTMGMVVVSRCRTAVTVFVLGTMTSGVPKRWLFPQHHLEKIPSAGLLVAADRATAHAPQAATSPHCREGK
jgi:hypothetical protein